MVRLINQNNIHIVADVAYRILKIQENFTYIRNFNYPEVDQCVFVMWHEHQFCVHGLKDRASKDILISTSLDGDIVAHVCENWGFTVVRGSAGHKGAVASTMTLLSNIKEGHNPAIMVDGPRGPYHCVKKGAPAISVETGLPIVPIYWYSEDFTFIKLPSWDKISLPLGPCRILNLYGDPIYPQGKSIEELSEAIKNSLLNLEKIAPEKYKEAKKNKIWSKKA